MPAAFQGANPVAVIGLVDVSTPELTRTRIDLTTGKSVVVSEALETAACNLQGIDPPLERGGARGLTAPTEPLL